MLLEWHQCNADDFKHRKLIIWR